MLATFAGLELGPNACSSLGLRSESRLGPSTSIAHTARLNVAAGNRNYPSRRDSTGRITVDETIRISVWANCSEPYLPPLRIA